LQLSCVRAKESPVKGTMILFSMLLTSCASAPPPGEALEPLEIICEPGDACCIPPPYRTYGCFSRMARRI
jgi:hypothetical protein